MISRELLVGYQRDAMVRIRRPVLFAKLHGLYATKETNQMLGFSTDIYSVLIGDDHYPATKYINIFFFYAYSKISMVKQNM